MPAADRAFIDRSTEEGRRNFRRAADPGQVLTASTIDEARTMELGERTGQLPGLVDRSGAPGADVKTTELDSSGVVVKQTDWSMKRVLAGTPEQLADSMGVATTELKTLARARMSGQSSPEFIADLKNITDERQLAAIEAELHKELVAQNRRILAAGSGQQPIDMRTVIDPSILKKRQGAAAAGGGPTK